MSRILKSDTRSVFHFTVQDYIIGPVFSYAGYIMTELFFFFLNEIPGREPVLVCLFIF